MPSKFFSEDDPTFAEEVLTNELKILWLENPLKYPYLREMDGMYLDKEHFDYGFGEMKLIGYGIANKPTVNLPEQKLYRRRSWWIYPEDPLPKSQCPPEGVIPQSIQAGKHSQIGRDGSCKSKRRAS